MNNPSELNKTASVPVTDDRGAYPKVWVAALVQTNCERRVSEKLATALFDNYVASQEELHRWSDRIKKVQRLVIPNIVFVNTSKERFDELKHFTFIRGLLTNPGDKVPAVIPDRQIETLRFMLGQTDEPVILDGNIRQLNLGGKVRVLRGSFRGLEGTVCRFREGDLHVGIHIGILGFAHVRIGLNDIEKI